MFNNINDVNNINGDIMKKSNSYHLFLFLTTFTRGIVESFSLVLLYKKGFDVGEILLFMSLMYGIGIVVNYVSLKINYKIVLIISSLLYGISYLYLTFMGNSLVNLILFSILLSFGTYSYHCIRHYLALNFKISNTSLVVNVMFLGVIIASIVGTFMISKLSILWVGIVLFGMSVISLLPIFKVNINKGSNIKKVSISKRKILFNIFEQFRVIFIELQPLFLYLYVDDSVMFVGGFNIVINISALVVLVFIRKLLIDKYYLYICFSLGLVLLCKISIDNNILLFIIAVMEGILIKLYERGSLKTLYNIGDNSVREYLMIEEFIFFIVKFIMMGIFVLLGIKLKTILFICIIGIVISGFIFKKDMR